MIFASSLKLLLVTSLVVAFTAFTINGSLGMHWWYLRSNHLEFALRVIVPALAWLLLMTLGLKLHRMHALWLLIGAPLVLYWPYMFITLAFECWAGTAPGPWCD
jgi:hypothetical protein